jgi:nucleoside-diphosphate-sugar epimerase
VKATKSRRLEMRICEFAEIGKVADAESTVHLAAVLDEVESLSLPEENSALVLNVVRVANKAKRIIYASSVWAVHEQTSLGPRGDYYAASKRAGEAIVRAWSDIHRRPAVSLRIWKFGPGCSPIEHEMLRVDATTLRWWFDKAIAYDEPAYSAWFVVGMRDHLKETNGPT